MPAPRYRVASPPAKPLLLWDGDCRFCQLWAERWRETWSDKLDLAPAQSQAARFPEIPAAAYDDAVQLIETDGAVYSGAEAILRGRALGRGRRGLALRAWAAIPGVPRVARAGYRAIAARRPLLSPLTRWLCGPTLAAPRYSIAAGIFLRTLAVAYGIAFASLGWQLGGLIGPDGILPAQPFLDAAKQQLGAGHWWQLPTLCWLFGAGKFLPILCAAGVALSVALFLRVAQPVSLALLWLGYLSLCGVGQVFLNYQWDALLLETGLLAILLAPARQPDGGRVEPPRPARWLLAWLLFRLMFMSGYVKLASGDPTWSGLTALTVHYQTQPLPTWLAWYAHQLPLAVQKATCAIMFGLELGVPFLLFGPRRLRRGAALALIAFQVLIALTGNYTFFNLLTIALCLLFLDDAWWSRWFGFAPRFYSQVLAGQRAAQAAAPLRRWAGHLGFLVFFAASLVVTLPSLLRVRSWPAWYVSTYRVVAVTRSFNSYGLFAVMTQTRPEIIIEGSADGSTWIPYEFKWKPGDLKRSPGFVAPHQPRLDWQLWFAALTFPRHEPWMTRFFHQLSRNAPAVTGLLRTNPFARDPPRYLRAMVYDYQFTTPAERRQTGNWWKRTPTGYYLQPTKVQ